MTVSHRFHFLRLLYINMESKRTTEMEWREEKEERAEGKWNLEDEQEEDRKVELEWKHAQLSTGLENEPVHPRGRKIGRGFTM